MKVRLWIDRRENVNTCRVKDIDLEEEGMPDNQWNRMSRQEKNDYLAKYVLEKLVWGFIELNSEHKDNERQS